MSIYLPFDYEVDDNKFESSRSTFGLCIGCKGYINGLQHVVVLSNSNWKTPDVKYLALNWNNVLFSFDNQTKYLWSVTQDWPGQHVEVGCGIAALESGAYAGATNESSRSLIIGSMLQYPCVRGYSITFWMDRLGVSHQSPIFWRLMDWCLID